MASDHLAMLKASLRGAVIGRDDPDYDEVRKLYNGMIDKRPRLIARCASGGSGAHASSVNARHRWWGRYPSCHPARIGGSEVKGTKKGTAAKSDAVLVDAPGS
jgi:hypothetical protein